MLGSQYVWMESSSVNLLLCTLEGRSTGFRLTRSAIERRVVQGGRELSSYLPTIPSIIVPRVATAGRRGAILTIVNIAAGGRADRERSSLSEQGER